MKEEEAWGSDRAHYPANCVHTRRGGASSPDGVWHTWVHLDYPRCTLGCTWTVQDAHLGALGLSKLDTKESKGAERITWALLSCKKLQDRRKEELVNVPLDKDGSE